MQTGMALCRVHACSKAQQSPLPHQTVLTNRYQQPKRTKFIKIHA